MAVHLLLLVVAVVVASFSVAVWKCSPDDRVARRFVAFTAAVTLWVVGVAGAHGGGGVQPWAAIAFGGASLIPPTLLALTHQHPIPTRWLPLAVVRFTFLVGFAFAGAALFTNLLVYDTIATPTGLSRRTGPLYVPFAVYFVVVLATAMVMLVSKWHHARGLARAQLCYLGIGVLVGAVGGIGNNLVLPFLTGQSSTSSLGPLFTMAYVVLAAHAIIRHRLMDVRLVIHRGLTVAIATALSVSPLALVIAAFWGRLSKQLDEVDLALFAAATVLVALLVPPTRDFVTTVLDRYVYRTQTNYQRTVHEASRVLTRVLNLRTLVPFLRRTVLSSTGAEGAGIYVAPYDGFSGRSNLLRLETADTTHEFSTFTAPARPPAEVVEALERTKEPVVADEVARESREGMRAVARAMGALNWDVVLPVVSEDVVIGAIVLGRKLSGDPFYPQDLDLLMTLANQAGIAIKNAQLYDQVVLANEYIENIVASIESGVVAIAANGQVAMFNRAAERLTGLDATTTVGRAARELPSCLGDPLLASVADGDARTQPEVALPGRVGTKPVICTTSPLRDPDGSILGAVAVFSDLTPLKELEVERRRAEKLAYFEVLASGIAHEIKNPLVGIKTFAQLLPRRHADQRFVDDFGRIVTREIARMERLVERLRELSRPGERPSRGLDLREPVRDAVETVQAAYAEKDVELAVDVGDVPRLVMAHHDELVQLILNLLMNAHEATTPGGTVVVRLTGDAEAVTLSVADSGPGVPAESVERIFDPFFTTKQHGSGLGLAICAGIAQRHGARLRVANRPEGGAVFTLDCPLAAVRASVTA